MAETVLIGMIPSLMKVIHVQLAHKRREVVVLEVLRKDFLSEFIHLLHNEAITRFVPADYISVLGILAILERPTYIDYVVGLN